MLRDAGLWRDAYVGDRHAWFSPCSSCFKPRAKRLGEFVEHGRLFFADEIPYDPEAVKKHLRADVRGAFQAWRDALSSAAPFEPAALEAIMRAFAERTGVKFGALVHATRVALTGRAVSPGLFDVIVLVGRERAIARMNAAESMFT